MIFALFGIVVGFVIMTMLYAFYVMAGSFIVWMVVDAAKQDKFWWVVLVIGVPIIGAAAYYFTEKKHDYAKMSVGPHEHKSA